MHFARQLTACFLLVSLNALQAAAPQARVNAWLITCDPGSDLYSVFGHSAIWIENQAAGIDRVYNYGTFDFGTDNFYVKFARGKLPYRLAAEPMDRFLGTYQYERRRVVAHKLNLTSGEAQALFAFLETNLLPENREYPYDFFFDNCATRPRDVLEKVLGPGLQWNTDKAVPTETFRQMIDRYTANMPWSDFGIDLALGMPCDAIATPRDRMFLPDELDFAARRATLNGRKLITQTSIFYKPEVPATATPGWLTPAVLTWFIFALGAIITFYLSPRFGLWFDRAWLAVFGLLGVLVLLLWFATDHQTTKWNLNLLWALPTHLAALAFVSVRTNRWQRYFQFTAILALAIILFWIALPQDLHKAVAPLILLSALRCWKVSRLKSRTFSPAEKRASARQQR